MGHFKTRIRKISVMEEVKITYNSFLGCSRWKVKSEVGMGMGEMEEVCSPTTHLPTTLYNSYLGNLTMYTIPWAFLTQQIN
jgi:hypothetical protein